MEKGVDIVALDMPLLDTRHGKDLIGTFLGDIALQVLSFVAENERTNVCQRQAEGIAEAKARGMRFGRTSKALLPDFQKAYQSWKNDKIMGQPQRKSAVFHFPASVTGRRFTKKPSHCERIILQIGVLFCNGLLLRNFSKKSVVIWNRKWYHAHGLGK